MLFHVKLSFNYFTGSIKLGSLVVDPGTLRKQILNQSIDLGHDGINALLNASLSLKNVRNLLCLGVINIIIFIYFKKKILVQ